jgi:hypothetical protein
MISKGSLRWASPRVNERDHLRLYRVSAMMAVHACWRCHGVLGGVQDGGRVPPRTASLVGDDPSTSRFALSTSLYRLFVTEHTASA